MSTFLHNKTISQTTPFRKEIPFPRFNVASQKRPGIRLSFEYTPTLLSRQGGERRTGTATMFRKMLPKYTIFSTVLSKIVVCISLANSHWDFTFELTLDSYEDRLDGCISNTITCVANVESFIAFSTYGERAIYDFAIFWPANGWFRITNSSTSKIHWVALIHCHVCRDVSDVWWI